MKLHFCCMNWSKWSALIIGYGSYKVQYRKCEVCNKIDFRVLGYDKQVSSDEANRAVEKC